MKNPSYSIFAVWKESDRAMEVSWSCLARLLTEPLLNSWFGELELLPDWVSVKSGAELEDPQVIRRWYEHSCPYHSVTKKTVKLV
jgi:hypothetical protein